MPKFNIYEVQKEVRYRRYTHLVDAKSEEDALLRLMMRDENYRKAFDEEGVPEEVRYITLPEPQCCGELGETEYGPSGYAARPAGQPEDPQAWEEAADTIEVGELAGFVAWMQEERRAQGLPD